jgi:hypothetical protein
VQTAEELLAVYRERSYKFLVSLILFLVLLRVTAEYCMSLDPKSAKDRGQQYGGIMHILIAGFVRPQMGPHIPDSSLQELISGLTERYALRWHSAATNVRIAPSRSVHNPEEH